MLSFVHFCLKSQCKNVLIKRQFISFIKGSNILNVKQPEKFYAIFRLISLLGCFNNLSCTGREQQNLLFLSLLAVTFICFISLNWSLLYGAMSILAIDYRLYPLSPAIVNTNHFIVHHLHNIILSCQQQQRNFANHHAIKSEPFKYLCRCIHA